MVTQSVFAPRWMDHATHRSLANFFVTFRMRDAALTNSESLYARIGGEAGIHRLVKAYLQALKTLPDVEYLRSLYPKDLSHYERRMTEFLSTWLGGPALYQERHGMPMLRESHRDYPIGSNARDEWMICMRTALQETVPDQDLRLFLEGAFWRMADSLRSH